MKILDQYILKRYIATFLVMLLAFIPIGIIIDLSEKVDKIIEKEVPFAQVADYYLDFTIYFAGLLFPLFIFLSTIFFTSRLANNTEIIAILSSGISFTRFLRPYLIGATVIAVIGLVFGLFLAPPANKGFNDFRYTYLKRSRAIETGEIYRQISDHDFIYLSSFRSQTKSGFDFSLEHFDGVDLKYKITANRIRYNPENDNYTLYGYRKRTITDQGDHFEVLAQKDTVFSFEIEDLTPVVYIAETLNYHELNEFIRQEKRRGSSQVNAYEVVRQKRWSTPISVFILTIIAVAVSSQKRRGGMGLNIAFGIAIGMIFVFFDKIFSTLASQSNFPPFIAVWTPNLLFGLVAFYLLKNAKR
ncbi:MAG: LptF/LptG family permease [Flavobacteriaceae bacterium]|nr:LptF/LptG family permease [Flavobacteriaceae bacterium]